jgi:hypothetical protein
MNVQIVTESLMWIPQCQKLLACKTEDCDYSSGEVEATAPPIVLHDLLSYAQYTISVAALAASWGPSKQLLFVTDMRGTLNLYFGSLVWNLCHIYRFIIIIGFHITCLLGFFMLVFLSSVCCKKYIILFSGISLTFQTVTFVSIIDWTQQQT